MKRVRSEAERVQRFLLYTVPQRDPNACWNWVGSKNKKGYGYFWNGKRVVKAHRFSYRKFRGPIPEGQDVLHTCDNPPCSNPAHLFTGTHADNNSDRDAKGRHRSPTWERHGTYTHPEAFRRGDNHPNSKLRSVLVAKIREWKRAGASYEGIAERLHLHVKTVARAARGQFWATVETPKVPRLRRSLSNAVVRKIRELYTQRYSQQTIADRFAIHQTLVGFIVRRVMYKDVK